MHFHARFQTGSIRRSLTQFLPPRRVSFVAIGFVATIVFFFGGWPLKPASSFGEFLSGLTYWLSQGQVEEGTVVYYLDWIVAGTPVLFGLAVIGVAGAILRADSEWFRWIFLAWAFFLTLILSLIGDQSWWNVVLLFPPIVVLAGCGVTDAWIGVLSLTDAARERFGTDGTWSVSSIESPSTNRILEIAISIVAVGATLAVVGAAPVPETVGGLDSPNRTTETGIQGVTVSERTNTRDRAFRAAREATLETGCPAIIGPDVYPWPSKWWFRGIEHEHVEVLERGDLPAVVVTKDAFPGLEEREYRSSTFDEHRVYVPPENCV